MLLRALDFAHTLLADTLSAGALAVDATLGNGHDITFLAEHVGPDGHVFGFDIQDAALYQTRRRLDAAGLADRCTLFQKSHEHLRKALPTEAHGRVRAVTFNLGYLPGGPDKRITTHPATTLPALEAALDVLAPGGLMTVVLYTGHPGGTDEADAVEAWAAALDQHTAQVLRYAFVNQRGHPPYLLAVEKGTPSG